MKVIPGFIKKLIKMLFAGTFTIIVAACYGVYMDYRNFLFHVKNPQDEPIPGLSLKLIDTGNVVDQSWTGEYGDAYLSAYVDYYGVGSTEYTVVIEDIDGPDNLGEFETVTMDVSGNDDTIVEYNITMDPVE